MTTVTMPDAEQMLTGHLAAQLPDAHVCADLPEPADFAGLVPIVQVARIGGLIVARKRLDNPRMDIQVFAATRAAANDLLSQVRGLVEDMPGVARDGGLVTRTGEETGPRLIPDPNTDVVRMGYTASLHIRPA
jgi:hypothetical protein